jgi:hypothetical protein
MQLAWWKRREQFIEGPLDHLRLLATTRILAGGETEKGLDRVVVHSRVNEPGLGEADREMLWRAFQLPVYEALYDAEGRLAASECEAHEGLHLTGTAANRDAHWFGKDFQAERGECSCGQAGIRIRRRARPRPTVSAGPALLTRAGATV